LDFQEYHIVPQTESIEEGVEVGAAVQRELVGVLKDKLNVSSVGVGNEGGFVVDTPSVIKPLEMIMEAAQKANVEEKIKLSMDVAASSFYKDGHYVVEKNELDTQGLEEIYEKMFKNFPIFSIEDGLDENDWDGWKILTDKLSKKTQLVGDDLFVTNAKILKRGIESQIGNAILIKVNQIGSLTETLETIALAKKHGYNTIISHRSGETEDTTIAHIAVATNSGQIKTGSVCRTDRICKYNELLRIEEELGSRARYGLR